MTTIRVRAVPVGAALQLTRRALELGPRFTVAGVLELLGDWWELGAARHRGRLAIPLAGDQAHPFTFALEILENS